MKRAKRQRMPKSLTLPRSVIDFFLMERGRAATITRFTQDGGVVGDVWCKFGEDLSQPLNVLITPIEGIGAVEVGSVLYDGIKEYRQSGLGRFKCITERDPISIAPLESFVSADLYVDELLRVILPLTSWWSRQGLGWLNPSSEPDAESTTSAERPDPEELQRILRNEIMELLQPGRHRSDDRRSSQVVRRVRDAAPVAALIGLIVLVANDPRILAEMPDRGAYSKEEEKRYWWEIEYWVLGLAEQIADAALAELTRDLPPSIVYFELTEASYQAARASDLDQLNPPPLVHRVFLDRKVSPSVAEGVCTVKADAACQLFNISCRNITWAVIDSGIDSEHPAFKDRNSRRKGASRIKTTLDFTIIDRIRNLALAKVEGEEREELIGKVIGQLNELRDYPFLAQQDFEQKAKTNLNLIAEQMKGLLQPDWALIEPLIRRRAPGDGEPRRPVPSVHGTHVAGILGADWCEDDTTESKGKTILRGICPDINLYDLRVINRESHKSTEYAVLAALEYVQFANRRTLGMKQVIHGVNISMSIPHEVRSYACGSTPICVSCNNLVGSGVVVVAAAGNRGWNEQEIGFGSFVFCSITDPGNAEDVITVGATHRERPHTYGVSYFSSRGPTGDGRIKPDLVAPGEKINGPIPDGSSDQLDGTSMAAPFVSGAAAMLLARNAELRGNPRRIKQILRDTATDLGREKYFQGHGLVDVLRALQSV